MITYYAINPDEAKETTAANASWVHLEQPSAAELTQVGTAYGIEMRELRAMTDTYENPRGSWLNPNDDKPGIIVVRYPVHDVGPMGYRGYQTAPLAMILLADKVITVSQMPIPQTIHSSIDGGRPLSAMPEEFALHIIWCVLHSFVTAMVHVNQEVDEMQLGLGRAVTNKQLYEIMAFQKSLIYFGTVLDNTMPVLKKLRQNERYFNKASYDEWLQSAMIEGHQAQTMANMTERILEQYNTTVSSIVSNNLNIIMKVLTSITIILTIPTVVGGLWGMNVPVPFAGKYWAFWGILAVTTVICGACAYVLHKNDYL